MKVVKSEKEWREQLSPEAFVVCRQHGTEAPFSGALYDVKEDGIYKCVCCGEALFESEAKFDSGTGWPSFSEPVADDVIQYESDTTYGQRVEVLCNICDAHLGHVFPDGPPPTGVRFCINSESLRFVV